MMSVVSGRTPSAFDSKRSLQVSCFGATIMTTSYYANCSDSVAAKQPMSSCSMTDDA